MIKMIVAAAGLSIGLLIVPIATAPAQAGINITIDGLGGGRISCGRGRRIVQNDGFWDVRTRNCSGRYYSYFGRRGGNRAYVITVDAKRAYITDVRRVYY
jgi:hypothetical protein